LHSVRSLGRAGLEDNELARISQEQSGGNETIYLAMGEGGDVRLSLKLGLKGSSEQDRSCSVRDLHTPSAQVSKVPNSAPRFSGPPRPV
jgi:hypothetical protein